MKIHKFGGTSLAQSSCWQQVIQIIVEEQSSCSQLGVVLSAMAGVTDALENTWQSKSASAFEKRVKKVIALYEQTGRDLLPEQAFQNWKKILADDLKTVAKGWAQAKKKKSRKTAAYSAEWFVGFGELWSAQLMTLCLQERGLQASYMDARQILHVEFLAETGLPQLLEKKSLAALKKWEAKQKNCEIRVVSGFVARTAGGQAVTLKRNGSDYSASLFASLYHQLAGKTESKKVEELCIWTDVDGVMSADPRRVEEAVLIPHMSYHESMELAFFGAKVLHPQTMAPLMEAKIPLRIRNTFTLKNTGTLIGQKAQVSPQVVKGISLVEDMALINLEGSGMMGVPGVAQRLFAALAQEKLSVMLISQASSEHSICFALAESQSQAAQKVVKKSFEKEIKAGLIQAPKVEKQQCILAVVGEEMAQRPGVSACLFSALGNAGVNVKAIAQGSSERNISVVLDQEDASRALQVVHSAFYLAHQTLSLGLVGPGLIGGTFLEQLHQQLNILREKFGVDIRFRGVANSRQMLCAQSVSDTLGFDTWKKDLSTRGGDLNWQRFSEGVVSSAIPHGVMIDCSASGKVAELYPTWMKQGFHVITPNKKANTAPLVSFNKLMEEKQKNRSLYLYETTVGAGLPVIRTLRDLLRTGDRLIAIEGIFSGTLAYLFNQFDGSLAFSQLVRQAMEQGLTEPDPREDLCGMDVARKLVILARELNWSVELEAVQVESLVAENLMKKKSTDGFFKDFSSADADFEKRFTAAKDKGACLRYVGSLSGLDSKQAQARVTLREVDLTHPFARTQGSDNIILFKTERYNDQPLIIQGPGAGPQVTAAGIFADLLYLVQTLGGGRSQL